LSNAGKFEMILIGSAAFSILAQSHWKNAPVRTPGSATSVASRDS